MNVLKSGSVDRWPLNCVSLSELSCQVSLILLGEIATPPRSDGASGAAARNRRGSKASTIARVLRLDCVGLARFDAAGGIAVPSLLPRTGRDYNAGMAA